MTLFLNQALEAEQAVLGCALIDSAVMDEVITLEPHDFSLASHELIWRAMKYQYANNKPIDYLTIAQVLTTYRRLEDIGGVLYLSQLAGAVPTTANVKYYADMVRSTALRSRGLKAAEAIRELSEQSHESDEGYLQQVERIMNSLRSGDAGNMKHISETKQEYMDYLQEKEDYILTGFKKLDEWSGGMGRGWLVIIAGRPSVGKTARILQQSVNMARQDIGEVLIWSQEMKRNQLLGRMLAPVSGINSNRIRKKTLEPYEMDAISKTYDELSQLRLHIEDASGVSIEHISAVARQIKRKYGRIGAIIVDYLTIMDIKQEKGQTWSKAVGEVTKRAKRLAMELDAPFFMLAQLSREGADGEPQLHHLRDSGEIEQDADVVEFLWHNPEETSQQGKVIQSFVAKGREIGINRFKYLFKGWLQKYDDYE